MARGMNFRVFAGLDAKGVQQGVKRIESSLNRLKMKFKSFASTIGVGLGIGAAFKAMAENAKKMDQASTTLKNVSKDYTELVQNQEFLMNMSNKYNQELIGLTGNFAKFHSSADQANMSLKDQQKVFESLTRASAFFNLTSDETNGVMLAITQMMSKGRVASEELRRQLGERLPGAFGLMASALNMTTAELEDAMRKGEVMAADALPKLADELNKMTSYIDVDTIQGQTNRVKNAFTSMVTAFEFKGKYKTGLKWLGNTLQWISKHIDGIKTAFWSILTGGVIGKINNKIKASKDSFFGGLKSELRRTEREADRTFDKLERKINRWNKMEGNEKWQMSVQKGPGGGFKANWSQQGHHRNEILDHLRKNSAIMREINDLDDEYYATQKSIAEQQRIINNRTGFWANTWNSIKATMKGVWASFKVGAIIAGFTALISKAIQFNKKLKDLRSTGKKLSEDYQKELDNIGNEGFLAMSAIRALAIKEMKDGQPVWEYDYQNEEVDKKHPENNIPYLTEDRQRALNIANDILNKEGQEIYTLDNLKDRWQDLTRELGEYYNKLKDIHTLSVTQDQLTKANLQRKTNQDEYDKKQPGYEKWSRWADLWGRGNLMNIPQLVESFKGISQEALKESINQLDQSIAEYNKTIGDLTPKVKEAQKKDEEKKNIGEVDENYEKIQKEYYEKLAILKDQKKKLLLTEEEYQDELEDLILSTIEAVYGVKGVAFGTDKFSRALLDAALALKTTDKIKDIEKDYEAKSTELSNQRQVGILTEEEYNDAMGELVQKTLEAIVALGDLGVLVEGFPKRIKDAFDKYLKVKKDKEDEKENKKNTDEINKILGNEVPVLGKRDTTFDYKKTSSEKLQEEFDIWNTEAEKLKELLDKLREAGMKETDYRFGVIERGLEKATGMVTELGQAAKLAEVTEDVKRYRQELTEGMATSFSSVASAIENIKQGIDSVIDSFKDPETTGWEKFFAILNLVSQSLDGILQSVQMFSSISTIIEQMNQAMAEQKAITGALTQTELASAGAKVAASEAEAMAGGTASAAKLPFPANLAIIASVLGTIGAIFASLPKFANGGIVGGHSANGDKLLARLNSGEMVLNKGQQATLYGMLNKQRTGNEVQFKIRGADLIGTINNYNKKITK